MSSFAPKAPPAAGFILLVIAAAVLIAGCSRQAILQKITAPEDRTLAAQVIADVQGRPGADSDLAALLQPQLRDQLAPVLPKIRAVVPAGPSRLVDANVNELNQNGHIQRQANLTYEVDGANNVRALVRIGIARQNGAAQVNTLYVNPLYARAEDINRFTLSGKSVVQYLVLILAILMPIFIVFSEWMLFTTKGIRRKWLWAIACIFGYTQIGVDWSNRQLFFSPLYINILGAGAFKAGLLGSWRLAFGLPIASLTFLVMRKRLQRAPDATPADVAFQ
jgi:hypothetical protein